MGGGSSGKRDFSSRRDGRKKKRHCGKGKESSAPVKSGREGVGEEVVQRNRLKQKPENLVLSGSAMEIRSSAQEKKKREGSALEKSFYRSQVNDSTLGNKEKERVPKMREGAREAFCLHIEKRVIVEGVA